MVRPNPVFAFCCWLASASALLAQEWPDQAVLERAVGRKALRIEDERVLHFYTWRRDIGITWQERPVEVFEGIALRSSFQRVGSECAVSGEWLVFADETLPLVATLTASGLRVASLVPRFPGASPQPFALRFFGEGSEGELGAGIAAAQEVVAKLREARPRPPAALPDAAVRTASAISEAELEGVFGRKAEVKNGVALFRFDGPRGLAGNPPGARMGIGVAVAFVGADARATVRLDAALERRVAARFLRELGALGFGLESAGPCHPATGDDLLQVSASAVGVAAELAHGLAKAFRDVLGQGSETRPVARPAFVRPKGTDCLGIASGALAPGWRSAATLPAGPERARWEVTSGAEPVLRMVAPGAADDRTFNLLCAAEPRFSDGTLTVRMRAEKGRIDQGGGVVWRMTDADNYYVTRFNPLEQDFRVYKVVAGVRTQLLAIGELQYRGSDWFVIEVTHVGDRITCVLNGQERLEVVDKTFPAAGGIGLWSKADSQCAVAGLWFSPHEAR